MPGESVWFVLPMTAFVNTGSPTVGGIAELASGSGAGAGLETWSGECCDAEPDGTRPPSGPATTSVQKKGERPAVPEPLRATEVRGGSPRRGSYSTTHGRRGGLVPEESHSTSMWPFWVALMVAAISWPLFISSSPLAVTLSGAQGR